jgi:hypothetical protein
MYPLQKLIQWHSKDQDKGTFDAFINQDKYLSERRGQYAERYGALAPWRGKWDMN